MQKNIIYWLPGMKVEYTGISKSRYQWLKETFPAYIAAWRLWLSFAFELPFYGIVPTSENIGKAIIEMFEYFKNQQRTRTNETQ